MELVIGILGAVISTAVVAAVVYLNVLRWRYRRK